MPEEPDFCDVALPVPVDRLFTYSIPPALQAVVQPGCRVLAPFASRKLTGVVCALHSSPPDVAARDILKLLDETPVLESELLKLGDWIAEYYCTAIGEVLKGMLPLSGEQRRSASYSLTDVGLGVARQLTNAVNDPQLVLLRRLEQRPRSATSLAREIPNARELLKPLIKRGWVALDETNQKRDPLRAASERLRAEFLARPAADVKLPKPEREVLAFLELHPGAHNLAELAEVLPKASQAARSLARRKLIRLETEDVPGSFGDHRPVPTLNRDQSAAFAQIRAALEAGAFKAFLLQGVTGSGKTEVYLQSIEAALALGKSALLLVPEIALTPAVAGQFFHRFGKQVAILHSAFGDSERAGQWRRIRAGEARVVVGTRSSIFAPVQNVGLIIVDEEHDSSYKQGETPRYHGRDVAVIRAQQSGAVAVLGSATPSVESRFNADRGKYTLLRLPERIAQRPMPSVSVVDMRTEFLETKKQSTFSRQLMSDIRQRLAEHQQVMLLLNRRGFASFMVCRSCGDRMQCVNCAVVLTHHRRDKRMLCHYCGYAEKVPDECPKCGSGYIQFLGAGSERVEDELEAELAGARIARLDRDTATAKGAFQNILQNFREGNIDILVGTQMIAKGHDIPNVTLVGVVLADIGLSMPDFRAAERSFQLLTQAAGRAGRGDMPGEVIVQTLNPEHYAIRFAAAQDYEAFYKKEIEFRKWLRYPPFAAFANIIVRDPKQEDALRMATELGHILLPQPEGVRVMGPAEAPVPRLMNEYRYQILLKAAKRSLLRGLIRKLRSHADAEKWRATALIIDVDPISLM